MVIPEVDCMIHALAMLLGLKAKKYKIFPFAENLTTSIGRGLRNPARGDKIWYSFDTAGLFIVWSAFMHTCILYTRCRPI